MQNRILWCVVGLFAGDILVNNMANARVGAPGFIDEECLSYAGHYFWPEQSRCKGEVKHMTWTEEAAAQTTHYVGSLRGWCCIPATCPDVCSGDIVTTEAASTCPAGGWSNQNAGLGCLKIVQQKKSWTAARTYCQNLVDGADLLVADTSEKLLEAEKFWAEQDSQGWYWVGGQRTDGGSDSQKWVKEILGEQIPISNGYFEPKYNHNSNVNYCTRMRCGANRNCQLDEITCSKNKYFICQIPA